MPNTAFERLHPRDRTGRDKGQFIDVAKVMLGMGAEWDAPTQSWITPVARRGEFTRFIEDSGFEAVHVPWGMRPATDADRKSLGLPPAWTGVVVATDPNAKLVAKGVDAAGRIQSVYSDAHHEAQSAKKFARIHLLEARIPELDKALADEALTNDAAAAVMLIRKMGLRPGSTSNTRAAVQAFGATTLLRKHVAVSGNTVRLKFVGKKGVQAGGPEGLRFDDPELARVLKRRLVGKTGDEPLFTASASDANAWLDKTLGDGFNLKDLRTRLGTALALAKAKELGIPQSPAEAKRWRNDVGKHVAAVLGNTPTVALASYVSPDVFGEWDFGVPTMGLQKRLKEIDDAGLNKWPDPGPAAKRLFGDAVNSQTFHAPNGTYSAGRTVHHDKVIGAELAGPIAQIMGEDHEIVKALREGKVLDDAQKLEVRRRAALHRDGRPPTALFLAGGPAAGKTTALEQSPEMQEPASVTINPDGLREALPEYLEMTSVGDRSAASAVHEESSDLAKRLHSEAVDLGLNVVLDGTGDSDPGKFRSKFAAMAAKGYDVEALYVTLPTDLAVKRAVERAEWTGRWVPVPELRRQHAAVSRNWHEIRDLSFVKTVKVYDNGTGSPKVIATVTRGQLDVLDKEAYARFVSKANEHA